jgi:hypothetical protein
LLVVEGQTQQQVQQVGVMTNAAAALGTQVGATNQPVGTTTVANPPLLPIAPTIGGIVQTTTSEYSAWTGGQPNVTWTGLAATAPTDFHSPNQLRPQSTGQAQKSYNQRKTGRTEKYKLAASLSSKMQ